MRNLFRKVKCGVRTFFAALLAFAVIATTPGTALAYSIPDGNATGHCHHATCQCATRGGDCGNGPGHCCWYESIYQHCSGHKWDSVDVTKKGDCEHGATVMVHCSICSTPFTLTSYGPRGHKYGKSYTHPASDTNVGSKYVGGSFAWYDYGNDSRHREECQNKTEGYDGEYFIYEKCSTAKHGHYKYASHTYNGEWLYDSDSNTYYQYCTGCGHKLAFGMTPPPLFRKKISPGVAQRTGGHLICIRKGENRREKS